MQLAFGLLGFYQCNSIMELPSKEQRVFVVKGYNGFRAQQVCVLPEATDEEILKACNAENPQLVTGGWHTVVRDEEHAKELGVDETAAPGKCVECEGRLHKIAICM